MLSRGQSTNILEKFGLQLITATISNSDDSKCAAVFPPVFVIMLLSRKGKRNANYIYPQAFSSNVSPVLSSVRFCVVMCVVI